MPLAPLRRCRRPGCLERQSGSWCARHRNLSARNHRGVPRQARGHGAAFDRAKRELAANPQPCALGLEGCFAAFLGGAAVGAALVAYDASRSAGAGRPGKQAAETWDLLYGTGDRIPLRIRWTFNKHFHRQATIEPGNAWRFRLIDDRGLSLEPIEIGHLEQIRDARDWIGEFRIWFPRRTIDGRLLITSHTRSLTLKVDGAAGDASLEWRFLPLLAPGDRPTLE